MELLKIAVFSCQPYEKAAFERFARFFPSIQLEYRPEALTTDTLPSVLGYEAISIFLHDDAHPQNLQTLAAHGTRLILLRSSLHDSVNLHSAAAHGITVMRVPAYSPASFVEYAVGILLSLARNIPAGVTRLRAGSFDLNGLAGMELGGKHVGLIGTGRVGSAMARVLALGFGCRVLVHDLEPRPELESLGALGNGAGTGTGRIVQVGLDELLSRSDVISLHVPATKATKHLINDGALSRLKPGALIVNASHGSVVDPRALIHGLDSGIVAGAALDVYEGAATQRFRTVGFSEQNDPVFRDLLSRKNVLVTGHMGPLTREGLESIANTTLLNAEKYRNGKIEKGDDSLAVDIYD